MTDVPVGDLFNSYHRFTDDPRNTLFVENDVLGLLSVLLRFLTAHANDED